ncbi:MAG: TatD family hydrolase [Caldilineaceae bacterium]|nr:TatD family hydrolase [Caldilineaceae bacterium]
MSAAEIFTPEIYAVDTHCHLDLEQFDTDRRAVVARAMEAGVDLVVNPGIDIAHSEAAIALAEEFPAVYAAVGVHPTSSGEFDATTVARLRDLAAHPKVVAIGEIGLDYYWENVPPAQQARAFQAQLELAADLGLPVIIHDRDAHDDVAATLETWVASDAYAQSPLARRAYAGVLHAFSGDLKLARRAYEWGFVLSLGGPVTFKNAKALHEQVTQLDPMRLMLETDAPYLTPHPYRGKRNEPAYIPLILARLAELLEQTPDQLAHASSTLALQFFGLEETYRVRRPASHQTPAC